MKETLNSINKNNVFAPNLDLTSKKNKKILSRTRSAKSDI